MGIKMGIIGFGYMGKWHLNNAPRVENVEVVAAYDIDPARVAAAKEAGLVGFDNLDDFLKSDLFNLVLVATPNDSHCALACASLKAGKHVICEKPPAMTLAELDQMIDTAKAAGRLFTVHQNRRWDKDYLTVKNVVESGDLGEVYAVRSTLHGARGAMFGWRADPVHGGGMIYDWGVHFVDQLLNLFGYDSVKSVFCKTKNVKTPDVEDYFCMMLDFKDGKYAQVEIGTFVLKPNPRWLVTGNKGTLWIRDFSCEEGGIICVDESVHGEAEPIMTTSGPTRTFAPRAKEEIIEKNLPDVPADLREYYANLRDAIDGKAELIVKPCQVRAVFKVLEAAFRSAETGEQVML
ncbi:MAG: Gfo/Idh/MocA family oxidoreductase [Clostridiales bacterium]|nr:Gfo/Idh/MocA family oxidoreductase [Clostridiales bacterium]